MQNFIKAGETITWVNGTGSDVASGQIVILPNGQVCAALGIILIGATGEVKTSGVVSYGKTGGLVVAQGDALFLHTASNLVTKTVTDKFIGLAEQAALAGDATVNVILDEAAQAAYVAAEATTNGVDAGTTQTLANALKVKVNAILTSLQNAGLMAGS